VEHVRLQGNVSTPSELATWETSPHHADHPKETTNIERKHAASWREAYVSTEVTDVTESTSRRSTNPSMKGYPLNESQRKRSERANRRSEVAQKQMDHENQKMTTCGSTEKAMADGPSSSNLGVKRHQKKEQ
jgi:hypothetical protein